MIYYAHSKRIYDTKQEKKERDFLEMRFKVICPNRDMNELGNIQPYLDKIGTCEMVICSEYKKHIGYGVFAEIKHALQLNKPIFVLRSKKLIPIQNCEVVDETDWKIYYGKIITQPKKKRRLRK